MSKVLINNYINTSRGRFMDAINLAKYGCFFSKGV